MPARIPVRISMTTLLVPVLLFLTTALVTSRVEPITDFLTFVIWTLVLVCVVAPATILFIRHLPDSVARRARRLARAVAGAWERVRRLIRSLRPTVRSTELDRPEAWRSSSPRRFLDPEASKHPSRGHSHPTPDRAGHKTDAESRPDENDTG
jgi:hypothetical protein